MSIDFSSDKKTTKTGTTTSSNTTTTTTTTTSSSKQLYESRSLLCKNKCGYYGNSMQYDGYCSICYRRMKQARLQHQYSQQQQQQPPTHSASSYSLSSSLVSSSSFDDASSLLPSSQSFNKSLYSLDEKNRNQIWNEQVNLSKFASKKKQQQETRRNSTFKLFRRPSSTLAAAVDTVTKVADKAVNIVDQSLPSSSSGSLSVTQHLPSFNQLANNYIMNAVMADPSFVEFNNSLNRLVGSPTSSASASSAAFLGGPAGGSGKLDESGTAVSEFEEQFRIYFPQLYQDLAKKMKSFVERFLDALKRKDGVFNGNKQYEIVQDFYKTIYRYILTSASLRAYLDKSASLSTSRGGGADDSNSSFDSSYSSTSTATGGGVAQVDDTEKLHEAIMIMVESYVTKSIYDQVFPLLMTEFEEQDMSLQKRIRSFHWVTNEMIGTCLDENSIFYRDSYEEALNYIVEMDSKHTAHEKMICITECSKNIYKAINISANIKNNINDVQSFPSSPSNEEISIVNTLNENSLINISASPQAAATSMSSPKNAAKSFASADDYLPAFIYIVLKANPTMLYSNMNFISRFAYEKRILQGEHAYHFCSLNAIITHIENLNAQHLNMSQEEFESYCNGLNETNGIANIFKIIQANLKILSELKDKQKLLKQEAYKLQSDMNTFRTAMQTNFNQCLLRNKPKYTNGIEGFERPVAKNFMDDLDTDLDALNSTSLPQPLRPTSSSNASETADLVPSASASSSAPAEAEAEATEASAAAAAN